MDRIGSVELFRNAKVACLDIDLRKPKMGMGISVIVDDPTKQAPFALTHTHTHPRTHARTPYRHMQSARRARGYTICYSGQPCSLCPRSSLHSNRTGLARCGIE